MEKESYMKKYRQYLSQIKETNENINMLFGEYKKEYAKFKPGDVVIYKGKEAVIEDYSALNDMSQIIYTVKTGKTLNYSIEEKDIKIKNKDMKHV